METQIDKATDITIVNQYKLHAHLFNNVLVDITDEDAHQRMSDTTNSFAWIAGHILWTQYSLANLLGITSENPYQEQFASGKKFDAQADYGSLEKMKADWNVLVPKITESMEQMSIEKLNAPSPFPIPYEEQTIRGLLGFQMHHLGYEIGQLGLYRRFLNKAAMSYQ
ncbi:MAG TPA: hypothetical protein DCS93_42355 [Microscillaceae bacterium]|nr:hypothetical protein [Microscillaceae bacterium]